MILHRKEPSLEATLLHQLADGILLLLNFLQSCQLLDDTLHCLNGATLWNQEREYR